MSPRADQERCCEGCGDAFVLSRSEQSFYAKKGTVAPRRCESCRDPRRETRREDDVPPEPGYDATCSACGTLTRLQFLPTAERPIYCEPCFRNR